MKLFRIMAVAAASALCAGAYVRGAEATTQTGTTAPAKQGMDAPVTETVECEEGYILLMPCPVCHTCPVCQANCGTAHALRCCIGEKKPATGSQGAAPKQQRIMTNKAEAVKHAAGRTPRTRTDEDEVTILTIEAE